MLGPCWRVAWAEEVVCGLGRQGRKGVGRGRLGRRVGLLGWVRFWFFLFSWVFSSWAGLLWVLGFLILFYFYFLHY